MTDVCIIYQQKSHFYPVLLFHGTLKKIETFIKLENKNIKFYGLPSLKHFCSCFRRLLAKSYLMFSFDISTTRINPIAPFPGMMSTKSFYKKNVKKMKTREK